jgi:hypothetical protein
VFGVDLNMTSPFTDARKPTVASPLLLRARRHPCMPDGFLCPSREPTCRCCAPPQVAGSGQLMRYPQAALFAPACVRAVCGAQAAKPDTPGSPLPIAPQSVRHAMPPVNGTPTLGLTFRRLPVLPRQPAELLSVDRCSAIPKISRSSLWRCFYSIFPAKSRIRQKKRRKA